MCEATSGRLLVIWVGDMCEGEERSDELNISDCQYDVASLQPSEGGIMLLLMLSLRSSRPSLWPSLLIRSHLLVFHFRHVAANLIYEITVMADNDYGRCRID